jgi:hypothetical protein
MDWEQVFVNYLECFPLEALFELRKCSKTLRDALRVPPNLQFTPNDDQVSI